MQLYDFYSTKGILADQDQDGLAEGPAGKISVAADLHPAGRLFALNLVARLAYESAAMPMDLLDPSGSDGIIRVCANPDSSLATMELLADGTVSFSIGADSPWDYFVMRFPYLWEVGEGKPTWEAVSGTLHSVTVKAGTNGIWDARLDAGDSAAAFSLCPQLRQLTLGAEACLNPNFAPAACRCDTPRTKKETAVDLLDLFSLSGVYEDGCDDLMHNATSYCVAVEESACDAVFVAAGNLISRLYVDCLSLHASPVVFGDTTRPCIRLRSGGDAVRCFLDGSDVVVEGPAEELPAFTRYLATEYPVVDTLYQRTISDVLDMLSKAVQAKNGAGQLTCLLTSGTDLQDVSAVYLSDLIHVDATAAEKLDGCPAIHSCREEQTIYRAEADLPWEVDVFCMKAETALRKLSTGRKVKVRGYLSQEADIRRQTEEKLRTLAKELGLELDILIYCAYKQGFSWIEEDVIETLKAQGLAGQVDAIRITFAPYFYEGVDNWAEYEGPVPPMVITDSKWQDLPIRFLQEIYPIDDVLSAKLGVCRDRVTFHMEKMAEHYRLECLNKEGSVLYTDTFNMQICQRTYLDEFPQLGHVLLNTGAILVAADGETVLEEQLKTDIESVWDYVQAHLFKHAAEHVRQLPADAPMPVFKNVLTYCDMCGVDYSLPHRTDTVSALEDLQEDIHFIGLEFFKHLGNAVWNREITEPGMILPFIRKKTEGGPHIVVELTVESKNGAAVVTPAGDGEIAPCDVALSAAEIRFAGGRPVLCLTASGKDAYAWMTRFSQLAQQGVISTGFGTLDVEVSTPQGTVALCGEVSVPVEKVALDPARLPYDRLASYSGYIDAMEHLRAACDFPVYQIERSYQGRSIYAVECMLPQSGYAVSRMKRINAKPTLLLNNRHHANEISSTSMAFDVIRLFLTDPNYEKYWKKLNIAIIPFSNVDGGAVHEVMQQDNPQWMLHAARFNSVGIDIRHISFMPDVKYGEGNSLPKLWSRWLPDIVADDHGIPHHECNFPAMGFQRPPLKEHWIPRSLFFGYLSYLQGDEWESNHRVNDLIKDRVADAINSDPEIVERNGDWKDRYAKYAHQWMPELFQANYYKDVIFYDRQLRADPESRQVGLRYPNITVMDWVTEVADETASGDYLNLCVRAHKTAAMATMDALLNDMPQKLENRDGQCGCCLTLCRKRRRPLQL